MIWFEFVNFFKFFSKFFKFRLKFYLSHKFFQILSTTPAKNPKNSNKILNKFKFVKKFLPDNPHTPTLSKQILKFHKNTKAPPPSLYFQPLKPFFVIFRNTFLKKFANFCHKSEKLYYNFIVIKNLFAKPCLFKRITASAHAFCAKLKASAERQKASHKSKVCLSY